jgi:hypothetical protein
MVVWSVPAVDAVTFVRLIPSDAGSSVSGLRRLLFGLIH